VADRFTVEGDLPAEPERAWRALVDDLERVGWWPHMELIEAEPGGRFEERWPELDREVLTSGTVTAAEAPSRLALDWADEGWSAQTTVTIELEATGEGTHARITHAGWDALPDGAALAAGHEAGWRSHLERWAEYLDR
jgi:uncharacterized protein YndB with AHSA1/START domain